jgi:DNA-binding MarR family transcriptional regulator
MALDPEIVELAGALRVSVGLLVRRARQAQAAGELTLPETSALARLDRCGPITAAALAKLEQISPQSMGATLGALEARGLVERRPDPGDGRQVLVSPSKAGLAVLHNRRNERTLQFAQGLSNGFTRTEIEQLKAAVPLIERLAETI